MNGFSHVSACLITTENEYPSDILSVIEAAGFGEIVMETQCPSMAGRGRVLERAKFPLMFTCDDDSRPELELLRETLNSFDDIIKAMKFDGILTVMSAGHIEFYRNRRTCLFNWGALIPKACLAGVSRYTDHFGEDFIYHREYDRILSYFNYPQMRIAAKVHSYERSADHGRVSSDPKHFQYLDEVERRCHCLGGT